MQILAKSIRIIDYKNNEIYTRETPESFDEYLRSLIEYVSGNDSVRRYKSRSLTTEVLVNALSVKDHYEENVSEQFDNIANRLLRTEIEVQEKVERLNVNVQKGSLIQALLYIENTDSYEYLLAKVEHTDFIDDADFSSKTGFQKNKNSYWKSCIINLKQGNETEYYAKVYTQGKVKYWWDSFLELDETRTDQWNTKVAFQEMDKVLRTQIKKQKAELDYRLLRNTFVTYMRSPRQINYYEMIDFVLNGYMAQDLTVGQIDKLRASLRDLPYKKNFDGQFNSKPEELNAKLLKTTYKVNSGIELVTDGSVPDMDSAISAHRDARHGMYLLIETDNEEVYRTFLQRN